MINLSGCHEKLPGFATTATGAPALDAAPAEDLSDARPVTQEQQKHGEW